MTEAGRVLVLGGRGFIGRHVVDELERAGWEVVATGRAAGSGWVRFDAATDDPGTLLDELRPDAVVNAIGRTEGSPEELTRANVDAVARLVDALRSRQVRLVHLGSSAEYGPGGDGPTPEDAVPEPVSAYGRSKLAATRLVAGADAVDAVVLRVFNPVGPGASPTSMPGRAAQLLVAAVRDGAPSILMGDLSAERDFLDVRDVADAVAAAIRTARTPRIVNVGRGVGMTARDLVRMIADAAGFTGRIEEQGAGSDRSPSVSRQVADVRRAAEALGWSASRSIEEAAAALVASLR